MRTGLLSAILCFCLQIVACKQTLHILGIYPRTGTGWTEPFVIYSAELARQHIEQNGTILQNYNLEIDWRDTECDAGIATKSFIDALAINRDKTYLAVFGGGCAVATSEVAAISYRYGLAQIAFASTAPNLGNRNLYPRFARGVPSDINAVPARAKFIVEQNWKRVAIINEQDPVFVASSHNMEVVLDALNIDYRVEDFAPSGLISLEKQVQTIANNLVSFGYRVIIANMYEDAAIMLFCLLRKQNEYLLLHPHATWIFLGWFTDQWHNVPKVLNKVGCTAEEVAQVSNGALGFLVAHNRSSFTGSASSELTISNFSPGELYEMYRNLTLENIGGSIEQFNEESDVHDAYVYDSLWTLALSLHEAETSGFNLTAISEEGILTNQALFSTFSDFSNQVYDGMLRQQFQGWSGRVSYVGHERHYDLVQILEFVNGSLEYRGEITNIPNSSLEYTQVEAMGYVLDPSNGFEYWDSSVASDGIDMHNIPVVIICVIYIISILMAAYISFYIVFITVGKFKNLPFIKNSSPLLTCIIICGNYFLVLAGVFFISNDRIARISQQHNFISNVQGEPGTTEVCDSDSCKFLCMFPVFLLLVASSVIFGGMMAKAALVYVVVVKLQINPNKLLNYIIAVTWPFLLATIDTMFVLLWSFAGPLVMKSEVLQSGLENPPYFSVIQCGRSAERTTATNILVGILIFYKSVLVLFGLVMAYNLRGVRRQILRYGNTISWTMYNMTIFTLVLILSFFLIQNYDLKLSIVSFLILLTVFLTVTIIGFPPVYYSIPGLQSKVVPNEVGNKSEIIVNRRILENSIVSLQKDNMELRETNTEMVNKLSVSGLDFPPEWNATRLDSVEEKVED